MTRIKIDDLPILESLSNEEVKQIFGGTDLIASAPPGSTSLPGPGVTQSPVSGAPGTQGASTPPTMTSP